MIVSKNHPGTLQGNTIYLDQKMYLLWLNKQESLLTPAQQCVSNLDEKLFEGCYFFGLINKKFTIGIRDLEIIQSFTTTTLMERVISIEYVIDGGSDMLLGEKNIRSNGMSKIYISSHSDISEQTRFHQKNEKVKSIGIWIKPKTLINDFGVDVATLPATMQSILKLEQNLTATIPAVAKVKNILNNILDHSFSGKLAEQFITAKFTELMCQTVVSFKSPELTYQSNNQLSSRKSVAMIKLLSIIDNNFSQTQCLDRLAKGLSMSRNSMLNTFKESYGMTITQYILQKRMEKAQLLLNSGKPTVLEVAIEVGYNDQSSFGRAYKRFFNHPPNADKPK